MLRQQAGMTQLAVSGWAGLSERSLRRIEAGGRRTRRSTLARIADALTSESGSPADSASALRRLLVAAGPTVADESEFAWRVEARRNQREAKRAQQPVTEHLIEYQFLLGGLVREHHVHRRWVTRCTVRERRYVRVRLNG